MTRMNENSGARAGIRQRDGRHMRLRRDLGVG
jgi:hypothetical protein